ncbi:MAG: hemolysin family protein [Phycisphaeraceae bacterium]|nr:hemolysin family protein [Phycisphaeraceae bacterium]
MDPVNWLIIAACLLGCYFAACHTALKTFSRRKLTEQLEEADKAKLAQHFIDRVDAMLLMTGVLRIAFSTAIALGVLRVVERSAGFDSPWADYASAFAVAALLLSVFIVAIPTSWARYSRETLLALSAPMLLLLTVVFAPIAAALHLIDPMVRRISGVDLIGDNDNDLSEEVLSTIEQHDTDEEIDQTQRDMLEKIIELSDRSAGEIMTPRTDVDGMEAVGGLMQVRESVLEIGHSRIPVYEESLDNIVGILYVRDLVQFVGSEEDFKLKSLLREPFLVPESKPVLDLLAEFRQRKVHLAIVLDEYGGTAGLITIEDVLEEIVGEIQDEYEEDEVEPTIQDTGEGVCEVDARVEIPALEDHLEIDLPEDREYDTVGGLVFAELGRIPEVGESFEIEGHTVIVTDAERTKVLKVRIEKAVEPGESDGE